MSEGDSGFTVGFTVGFTAEEERGDRAGGERGGERGGESGGQSGGQSDEVLVLRGQKRRIGGAAIQLGRRVRGSWSITKEDRFLLELSATCNVSAACRAVRMSTRSAYSKRAKDAGFRRAWAVAIGEGYAALEQMMLQRSIGGDDKPVFYQGKQIATVREYPDRIAMVLFAHHKDHAVRACAEMTEEEVDEARSKLAKRLAVIRAQREARERAAAGGDG
jgi:hypothetical protein